MSHPLPYNSRDENNYVIKNKTSKNQTDENRDKSAADLLCPNRAIARALSAQEYPPITSGQPIPSNAK